MNFKKKFLLLTLFLIIVFNTLIYINNNHKTSFRYFRWTVREVSIGKLVLISFFSGLFISTLSNTKIAIYQKNNFKNIEEDYEPLDNEEDDIKSNVEMPPQRDVRDAQPTISVNYRVVRNTEENNLKRDQNFLNIDDVDDWDNDDNEW